jgi:hypothetical protein
MADSEISTTLPIVSRGTRISTSFAASDSSLLQQTCDLCGTKVPLDPAVLAGRKWRAAHDKTLVLCRRQQRLETKLQHSVGMPCAPVEVTGLDKPVRISSLCDLDRLIERHPEALAAKEKAMADLTAHQRRWDEADRALGYSITREKEDAAAQDEQRLADLLWSTPASSLGGIAAKIEAVVATGEPKQGSSEFPWPRIRSALTSLREISKRGGPPDERA